MRFLVGHHRKKPREILQNLVSAVPDNINADVYGSGEVIEDFEMQIAKLLGKPSAVFMPSGTMAQPIALRIWSERKGIHNFAFHPKSHLELHEHKGYQFLHNLYGVYVGNPNQLMNIDEIRNINVPISSLLIELPQREIGGHLPSWQELIEIRSFATQHNISLHLDGARLWECKPFYQKDYDEICSLFDSVYVSFYKGIGAIAGAILAGDVELVNEAKIWKRRQGGDLVHLYPYVISCQQAFAERLPKMNSYCEKAKAIAKILQTIPQIRVTPKVPMTNMMHVYIEGVAKQIEEKALEIEKKSQVLLFRRLSVSEIPGFCKFELSVGDATLEINNEEIYSLFTRLL